MAMLALGLIFAIFVSIFALQNASMVQVRFFGWSSDASQAVVILVSALGGALVVACLSLIRQVGQSLKARELRGKIANLELEIKRLGDEKQVLIAKKREPVQKAEAQP